MARPFSRLVPYAILGALALPPTGPAFAGTDPAAGADFIGDMREPSEARPHGVPPAWGWPVKPLMQAGNRTTIGGNRILPWWQVYEAAEGNPATNTRVEVRGLVGHFFSASKQAYTDRQALPAGTLSPGGLAPENYQGGFSGTAGFRLEPDGGTSVKPGNGLCAHGWTPAMIESPVEDLAGLVVTLQVRLVVDDPGKPDDRDRARFVASAGADYWRAPKFDKNEGIAIGRFRRVTKEWRTISATTMTAEALAAHPPPR